MKHSPIDRARAAYRFLKLGLSDFDTTASLVPSSRYLVDAMLRPADLSRARVVVELGTGTGTLTRALLAQMPEASVLYGLELDGPLLDATTQRVGDARLRPVHDSAAEVDTRIDPAHLGRVDAVVSSLGLSLMSEDLRSTIARAAGRVLGPQGVYIQYAYLHARWFAYSQTRRAWFRWAARPFLEAHFLDVRSTFVPANVPPAVVYTCRRPLRSAS